MPEIGFNSSRKELRLVGTDWRNDMKMVSKGHPGEFNAFFRRSEDFPENFSIGLSYDPKDGSGEITLLRCNGPHGVFNGTFDPTHPHWGYHIHKNLCTVASLEGLSVFNPTEPAQASDQASLSD